MKFTYNWLKDFVEVKLSPEELAQKLTMAGLEVKAIEPAEGDFVFEVEITSNRPDWLSVAGIAHEVAALTRSKVRGQRSEVRGQKSEVRGQRSNKEERLKIEIEDKKDCPLYTAKIIREVKVAPSPAWLKKRLQLVGCRSINNIVDITNYILFTYGEPLHAFDLDRLQGEEISIRRAKKGEKLVTIDGVQRDLDPEILVIADSAHTVAVAGVMGGKDTEVSGSTKNILLEAAVFDPVLVRRGRQKLLIQTDSSYRFERGVDFETALSSSWQATQMIQEIAGGSCVMAKEQGSPKPKEKSIHIKLEDVSRALGVKIPEQKVKNILKHLGFGLKEKPKESLLVTVPLSRPDINIEADLVEEISRIFGYDLIPTSIARVQPKVPTWEKRDFISLTKNVLVSLGLQEVITYSLLAKEKLAGFLPKEVPPLEILNPLSQDQAFLRPCLTPSLLECVGRNFNQKQEQVYIFEIASAFLGRDNPPKEELTLGIAVSGVKPMLLSGGLVREEANLLQIKGIIETLFLRLGIKDIDFQQKDALGAEIIISGESFGKIFEIASAELGRFEIKNRAVFCAELSLDKAFKAANLNKRFIELPKYPHVARDISFVVKSEIAAKEILTAVRESAGPLLYSAQVVDYYTGKQIPAGSRGLTISCLWRSAERTLTEEEVGPSYAAICAMLKERFGVQLR